MRLLDRYLLRELIVPLAYCLGGFTVFWTAFNLMSEMEELQRRHLNALDIAQYCVCRLPELLVIALPMGLLLALLYALTNHARHHELTAMRAAGISLWRLCLPYFALGLACAGVLFALTFYLAQPGAEQAEKILNRRSATTTVDTGDFPEHNLTFTSGDGRRWLIGAYDPATFRMLNPHITWPQSDGSVRDLRAARAERTNDTWLFHEVELNTFPPGAGTLPQRLFTNQLVVAGFTETPAEIKSEIKVNRLLADPRRAARNARLTLEEIAGYQRLHRRDRTMLPLLATHFHRRLAEPFTCVVVVLIAIPFGAPAGRRNVFVGVAASVFICFAYFVLLKLGVALGVNGSIPAWFAAWGPNLLFGATGIVLTQRVR